MAKEYGDQAMSALHQRVGAEYSRYTGLVSRQVNMAELKERIVRLEDEQLRELDNFTGQQILLRREAKRILDSEQVLRP